MLKEKNGTPSFFSINFLLFDFYRVFSNTNYSKFNIFCTLDLKFTKSPVWFPTIWWICNAQRQNIIMYMLLPYHLFYVYTGKNPQSKKSQWEFRWLFFCIFSSVIFVFFRCRLTSMMKQAGDFCASFFFFFPQFCGIKQTFGEVLKKLAKSVKFSVFFF